MLEGRAEHHSRVASEYILSAITVVHIKINNRYALDFILRYGMGNADCDMVKNTEACTISTASMMPRWPGATECIIHFERLEYLEPEYFDDQSHEAEWRDYLTKIDDLIAKSEGRLPTPRLTANQRKGA